jgi:hypothetical protein
MADIVVMVDQDVQETLPEVEDRKTWHRRVRRWGTVCRSSSRSDDFAILSSAILAVRT